MGKHNRVFRSRSASACFVLACCLIILLPSMPMAYAAQNIRMLAEVTEATNTALDSYVFVHATTETISVVTPANGTLTIIYNYSFEQGLEPIDVRIDSSGNYIISEVGFPAIPTGGMITKITPGGVRTVIYTFPKGVNPSGIAIDSSGNYIVVEGGSNVLSKITPGGVRTVIYNFSGPVSDVTVDFSGNYIVTELWPDALSKITPSGARTVIYNFTMPPNMVHVDPSGNYIVTESTASLISKITPDGVRTVIYHFTNLPIHFPTVWPSDAWVDSSGNYIVTESNNHVLSKITPDGVRTVLYTFPSLGSISAFAPIPQADTEPPVISSTSPSNASTLSNPTVTINAHYSDNVAIRNYSFKIDGVAVTPNTVTASELEYVANFSEGPHTVQLSVTDTSDNVATATWSFTVQVAQPSRCFIATATYGSEAAPQVQFLRGFRDNIAMQTFAGSSFMNVFLGWYYSWSPTVAYSIAPDDSARAVMRVALQPILDILQVAAYTYSTLSFNGEFAIVMAGFVVAALIGLVYFTPFATIALIGAKKFKRNLALPSAAKVFRFVAIPWIASITLIIIAELALAPILMMIATAMFVIFTIVLTVSTTSLWLAGLHKRG